MSIHKAQPASRSWLVIVVGILALASSCAKAPPQPPPDVLNPYTGCSVDPSGTCTTADGGALCCSFNAWRVDAARHCREPSRVSNSTYICAPSTVGQDFCPLLRWVTQCLVRNPPGGEREVLVTSHVWPSTVIAELGFVECDPGLSGWADRLPACANP